MQKENQLKTNTVILMKKQDKSHLSEDITTNKLRLSYTNHNKKWILSSVFWHVIVTSLKWLSNSYSFWQVNCQQRVADSWISIKKSKATQILSSEDKSN